MNFTPYVSIVVYWNWKIWSNNISQSCMKSEDGKKQQNYNERMEWKRSSLIAVFFWPQTHNHKMNSIYWLITVKSVLFTSTSSSSCCCLHILTYSFLRSSFMHFRWFISMHGFPLFSHALKTRRATSSSSTTSYLIQKLCNHHRLLLWLYIIHFK